MLATSPIREHKSPLYSLPQLKFQRSSSAQLLHHTPQTPQHLRPLPLSNSPLRESPPVQSSEPPPSPHKPSPLVPPQDYVAQQQPLQPSPPQLRRLISTTQLLANKGNKSSSPPPSGSGAPDSQVNNQQQSSPHPPPLKRLANSSPQIKLPHNPYHLQQPNGNGNGDGGAHEVYPFDLPDKEPQVLSVIHQNHKLVASLSFKEPDSLVHRVKGLPLEKLIEKIIYFEVIRYHGPGAEGNPIQRTLFDTKKKFIQSRTKLLFIAFIESLQSSDLQGDQELFDLITMFYKETGVLSHDQFATLIEKKKATTSVDRFEKSMRQLHLSSENTQQLPELSVDDVVYEITLQEFKIFGQINAAEFLSLEWSGPKKRTKAPLLTRLIGIFNWVTTWIASRILMRTTPEERADVIEFFVSVGMKMKEMNNLNGVMEVVSSLKSTPIFRLSASWLRISKTAMDNFKSLVDLMDCEKNFRNYRIFLSHIDPYVPCLPYHLTLPFVVFVSTFDRYRYLGLLLTDITFACEGNQKYLDESKIINMNYLKQIGNKVNEIKRYQKISYSLPAPSSSIYLEVVYEIEELFKLSKLREDKDDSPHRRAPQLSRVVNRRTVSNQDFVPRVLARPTDLDLQMLFANAKILKYKAGELIRAEGVEGEQLFVVQSGKVAVRKFIGKLEQDLYEASDGEFLDVVSMFALQCMDFDYLQLAFLDNRPTTWHALAATAPTTLVAISFSLVKQLLASDVDFASRMYKYFGNIVADLIRRAMNIRKGVIAPAPLSNSARRSVNINSKQVDPPAVAQNKEVAALFGLPEVALKVFDCKFKVFSGKLYIFPTYIGFNAKAFGFVKRFLLGGADIAAAHDEESILIIQTKDGNEKKFVFRNQGELMGATALAKTIVSKKITSQPGSPLPDSASKIS